MYSYEDRIRAVKFYITCGYNAAVNFLTGKRETLLIITLLMTEMYYRR